MKCKGILLDQSGNSVYFPIAILVFHYQCTLPFSERYRMVRISFPLSFGDSTSAIPPAASLSDWSEDRRKGLGRRISGIRRRGRGLGGAWPTTIQFVVVESRFFSAHQAVAAV